jgi:hypothetical protein
MPVPTHVPDGWAELKTELTELLKSGVQPLKAVRHAIRRLKDLKIGYNMRVPIELVGCHLHNRDGTGVNPADVHRLVKVILDAGWSDSAVEAVYVELDSSDTTVADFNRQLVAKAAGKLAPVGHIKRLGVVRHVVSFVG